jgi:PhnB protein
MPAINPYITFIDNCEKAFEFYKSVFGGEYAQIVRFKDMPMGDLKSAEQGEKIMHIGLPIGRGSILMGSDSTGAFGPKVNQGNNFSISVDTDSEDEAKKIFSGLSAGGNVTMPLDKAPWGALFGMFTDKFGINWMVNYDYKK